jgi:hypothetical protein
MRIGGFLVFRVEKPIFFTINGGVDFEVVSFLSYKWHRHFRIT